MASLKSQNRPFSNLSGSVERAIGQNSIENLVTETVDGIDPNFNYSP